MWRSYPAGDRVGVGSLGAYSYAISLRNYSRMQTKPTGSDYCSIIIVAQTCNDNEARRAFVMIA